MNTTLALFNLGGMEVVLIFAVILLLFGARKLPELARGLGQGIKEFKKATSDVTNEMHRAMEEDHAAPAPKPIQAAQTEPASTNPPSQPTPTSKA